MPSTELCFNDFTFSPVSYQNNLWIRAAELSRALGYSDDRKVSRLYQRNADEFTPDMTQLIEVADVPEMGTTGNLVSKVRIFSLRGCHLLAMFARTPVAKQFRRWVLDVLDRLAMEERAALPSQSTLSTAEDRKPLRALVHAWAQVAGVHHAALWPQVKAHFQLSRIDDLPAEWIPDALAFVQGKIDELGKAKALPLSNAALAAAAMSHFSLPPSEMSENDIVDDATNRRLKRVLRDLHAMQEQCGGLIDEVRICLSPKGKNFFLPEKLDNTYKTLQHLNFAATAGVYMTRQALISAYHIGRGIEFC